MPVRKVTTEDSITLFRTLTEDSVRQAVHDHAVRSVEAFVPMEENIRRYNIAIARWMRDHHRALGAHYSQRLEECLKEDKWEQ